MKYMLIYKFYTLKIKIVIFKIIKFKNFDIKILKVIKSKKSYNSPYFVMSIDIQVFKIKIIKM